MEITKGQKWKDLDRRCNGRTVVVEEVKGDFVFVKSGNRRTRINKKSFHNDPDRLAGFALVSS